MYSRDPEANRLEDMLGLTLEALCVQTWAVVMQLDSADMVWVSSKSAPATTDL